MHKTRIDRGGGRILTLYSQAPRSYQHFDGLPPIEAAAPHLRWHPLRCEWVGLADARQDRTFLPNKAECPLCPITDAALPSDIPVDSYEVAIFSNRFAALIPTPHPPPNLGPPNLGIETKPGKGFCDVVAYTPEHNTSLAQLGAVRLGLLLEAIADRCLEIYSDDAIQYVLPFENRGREIGVTLDHPHGQIYGLSHLPEVVKTQARAFQQHNPLGDVQSTIAQELVVAQNEVGMAFCPPWARYPFEVWVVPFKRCATLADFDAEQRGGFAALLAEAARKLDAVFDAPMPYVMSWQIAPKGFEASHHFHCLFQPQKRSKHKQKYLSSVEQFTGFFLLDVPPERAADILNGKAAADE